MTRYSYLKTKLFATCLVVLVVAAVPLTGQYGAKRDRTRLRALGVLETYGAGQQRLIPVIIYADGKFYDAGFYQSAPAPLALDSGTVYELQKSGMPDGLFTIKDAERLGTVWYGEGSLQSKKNSSDEDEGSKGKKASLKDEGDPDRPTLTRPKPAAPEPGAAPAAPSVEASKAENADPERPMLKRGAPTAAEQVKAPLPETGGGKRFGPDKGTAPTLLQAAISDAKPVAGRPLDFAWDEQQKKQLMDKAKTLAIAELRKAAKERGIVLDPKDPIDFFETNIRAFDVDYSNNAQLVYSARFQPSAKQMAKLSQETIYKITKQGYWVTVVARQNYNTELEKIFAEVSDPQNLDDYPVMRLVDAVDVDGDSRAELVFANTTDAGRKFVVYRLYGLNMTQLFVSGAR